MVKTMLLEFTQVVLNILLLTNAAIPCLSVSGATNTVCDNQTFLVNLSVLKHQKEDKIYVCKILINVYPSYILLRI